MRSHVLFQVSVWLGLLSLSQFHLMFYLSRPLPNTMALIPTLVSLAFWLRSHSHWFIFTAAAAILIFRLVGANVTPYFER